MVHDSYDTTYFDKKLFIQESERLSESVRINKVGILNSFNFLRMENPSFILDLGCGTGEISLALARFFPNSRVIGLDRENRFITENMRKYSDQKNLTFVQSDCYSLPFESNSIDLCYSRFLFQHLRTPDLAIAEIFRVLKPKGKIGIFDIDKKIDIIYPFPVHSKKFNTAEVFYKKLIRNDLYIGRKLISLLLQSHFNNVAKLDVSIDSLNTNRTDIVRLIESWNYFDFNSHPYVMTKRITSVELKEYFEDLLKVTKQTDSYICFGLVFITGSK